MQPKTYIKSDVQFFNENIDKVEKSILVVNSNYTAKALFYSHKKIEAIKLSIEKMVEIENTYSTKVLIRILLEHYIIAYYIFFMYYLNRNDNCGKLYYEEYLTYETIKQKGYKQKVEKMAKKGYKNLDGLSYLKKHYSEYNNLTEEQYKKICSTGKSFKIDNIIEKLLNINPIDKHSKLLHIFMLNFLDKYNILSSYIHGGPFAENSIYSKESNKSETEETLKFIETLSNSVKSFLLLFLSFEDKFFFSLLNSIKK